MKCFYHKSDLDGHCSGAIIKLRYPECEMIGVDYQDSLYDLEPVNIQETVYVVDFSFPMQEMEYLNKNCDLHWIDHHKTSIDEAHKKGFISSGGQSLEIGKAGCELTWEYIHPDEKTPLAVYLLGRYDVWDHSDERTLPFQMGMRQYPDTFPDNDFIWSNVLSDLKQVQQTLTTGGIILEYQKIQDRMYAKGMAYDAKFEGYRAIVMNKEYSNSKAFDAVYDPEKHDIMIMFGVKPDSLKYTLFCDKPEIDVSKIAKKYGGGGHRGAAGFFSKELLI